ncbi:MAG: type II toxin-antitoxin system RelE/ParE family toxin [Lachnospiraceae bacterium]|nr:type II toxin-antitoxin system RelE/ParE family toxin [Lachnospiraceae bacterium]MBQ2407590.1 type II toxin-antitoxin system RelE/ParE family toxin [Lachnospiraceae bacterium]
MQYSVEISELAEKQYDDILSYIANQLKNPQAVKNVIDDFDSTVNRLEKLADKFGFCKSERLKVLGLHKIRFEKHRYLFLYRIDGQQVVIEGMYHELQDYENAM